jgi:hypothetical protein
MEVSSSWAIAERAGACPIDGPEEKGLSKYWLYKYILSTIYL